MSVVAVASESEYCLWGRAGVATASPSSSAALVHLYYAVVASNFGDVAGIHCYLHFDYA